MRYQYPPFASLPDAIDIGYHFRDERILANDGCDGHALWRYEEEYCYAWVTMLADHDMWVGLLLDIRTNREGVETRDYLWLAWGINNLFEVEWHNKPIRFDAPTEEHLDRWYAGAAWFRERNMGVMESRAKA